MIFGNYLKKVEILNINISNNDILFSHLSISITHNGCFSTEISIKQSNSSNNLKLDDSSECNLVAGGGGFSSKSLKTKSKKGEERNNSNTFQIKGIE